MNSNKIALRGWSIVSLAMSENDFIIAFRDKNKNAYKIVLKGAFQFQLLNANRRVVDKALIKNKGSFKEMKILQKNNAEVFSCKFMEVQY